MGDAKAGDGGEEVAPRGFAARSLARSFSRGSLRSQVRTPMNINAENGHFFLVNLTESNPWKQGPTLQQKDRILIKDLMSYKLKY